MTKSEREHWAYRYGRDANFIKWISFQPSCIDGSYHQYVNGVGRNIPCHYRSIKNGAGMGIKPPFSAVPMTQAQHELQTAHGYQHFFPRDWWENEVILQLNAWIQSRGSNAANQ